VRAIPFNRPGMHNGCMMLFVAWRMRRGRPKAQRIYRGGPDRGMASAIDQANTLDLDDSWRSQRSDAWRRRAGRRPGVGAGVRTTDGSRLDSACADFRGFSPAPGADQPAGCPHCGGEMGEIDVLPSYAIVSHIEADGRIEYPGTPTSIGTAQRPAQPAVQCMASAGCSSFAPLHLNSWR